MRTHSGLHVLCGVVFRDFGALVTGGNMGAHELRGWISTCPRSPRDSGRPSRTPATPSSPWTGVSTYAVLPLEQAFALPDIIRTATNLVPPEVENVRIIDIVGLDEQADGGTHVASSRQVGRIQVVKVENKGKGFRLLRIQISGSVFAAKT